MELSYTGQCGLHLGIKCAEKLVSAGEMWPDVRNIYSCLFIYLFIWPTVSVFNL